MSNFNFSKPATKTTNEKRTSFLGKIWAGLNLIALFGDVLIPKKAKDNLPIKVRNGIILFLVLLVVYMILSGIFINVKWLLHATHGISFSLGNTFYYFGILAIIFTALSYFNLDNTLIDFSNQKKIIKSALKDISKGAPQMNAAGNVIKQHKSFTVVYSAMGAFNFFWVLCGVIFHERYFFLFMFVLSAVFSFSLVPVKDISIVKKAYISEIIINIILLSGFLINHFFIS